jgi:HPt (histidine-containing phosphotransfer) domain-containing protein
MAFKRLIQQNSHIYSCSIFNSCSEFKEAVPNLAHDLLVVDNNLGDGNAQDIIQLFPDKKIVVLTGTLELNWTFNEKVKVIAKPLEADTLHHLLHCAMNDELAATQRPSLKYVNLNYLEKMVGGDNAFMVKMLTLTSEELGKDIISLHTAMETADFAAIKFHAHRLKTRSRVLGLGMDQEAYWIESHASAEFFAEIKEIYAKLELVLKESLIEVVALIEYFKQD